SGVAMRRREFLGALGGTAALWVVVPLAGQAQQPDRISRIGVIVGAADDPQGQAPLAAIQDGMRGLEWTDARNVHFEIRFSGGSPDRARSDAADMVGIAPNVKRLSSAGGRFQSSCAILERNLRTMCGFGSSKDTEDPGRTRADHDQTIRRGFQGSV